MNWCEAPYIFNPGTKWRWLVSFTWHPCHTLVFFRASVDLEFIWAWWQRETSCPYLNHTPAVQPIASDFTDSCHGAQWREGISQTCFLLPLHCLCYVSIKKTLDTFVNPSFTSSVSGKSCAVSELLYLWMKHLLSPETEFGHSLKHCFTCPTVTRNIAL